LDAIGLTVNNLRCSSHILLRHLDKKLPNVLEKKGKKKAKTERQGKERKIEKQKKEQKKE
jgi:hypothetical protein